MGGVHDEDVEPAERLRRALGELAGVALVGDVARQGRGLAARVLDEGDDLVRVRLLAREIGNRHVGPLPREGDGDGPADPRIAPRDQRAAPREPPRTPVALLAVVRRRLELAREAGRGLRLLGKWRRRVLPAGVLHLEAVGHGGLLRRSGRGGSAGPVRTAGAAP
jgi:hypothetical protein